MLTSARTRAKKNGIPFSLTVDDIKVPTTCPVLGIPLVRKLGTRGPSDNSPTIDRVVPELGYQPGNIVIVSMKANRIKNDATPNELRLVARYAARQTTKAVKAVAK